MVTAYFLLGNDGRAYTPFAASSVMYQRARKLASLIDTPADFMSLSELQLEAYVVSINALFLIDSASAWFVMPVVSEHDREVSPFKV